MMNFTWIGVRHAKALLVGITECGVEPPDSLTRLVSKFDQLAAVSQIADPMAELVRKFVAEDNMKPGELDKLIAQAATAKQVAELRSNLKQ